MKKKHLMDIGSSIRRLRELQGRTQSNLAKAARATPACISQIEGHSRIPSVPVLLRIADALSVSLDSVCGRGKARMPEIPASFKHPAVQAVIDLVESLNE